MLHDYLVKLFKNPLSLKSFTVSLLIIFIFSLATFTVYLTGKATRETRINIAPKAAEIFITPTGVGTSSAY